MHTAATESVFVGRADEKLTAVLELEAAISPKLGTLLSANASKGSVLY